MTIHELFQGCRRYLIKVDRLENVKISGGDSDAGRVYPVLEFYENVSSPSRLKICLKFIGDQVAGLKVPVHRFIVASVLHAGDGYTVSSAKASSVIVAFEIFHLLLWGQHFLKYTNERSLEGRTANHAATVCIETTRRATCDDVCDRVRQNSAHK